MLIYAFRHDPLEELGNLRTVLERRGFRVESVELYRPGASVPPVQEADGLVFMGGPMSANDDLPYLHREVELIREAAGRGQPLLGICLGGQLISMALGGAVHRNPVTEIGWYTVDLTPAGVADPLFRRAANPQTVFHWHQDTFDVPPGGELLATAPDCHNQAFRKGLNIYGMQFHPEMTPRMIEDWQRHAAVCGEAVESIDPHRHAAELAVLCEKIVGGWTETF
jgi:GMP synthase-like glutamine amidotransferase